MSKWLFPTLGEILQNYSDPVSLGFGETLAVARQRAEWSWSGAIAALGQLLQRQAPTLEMGCDASPPHQGVILCGPLPLFTAPDVLRPFANWIFIPDVLATYWHTPPQLLPGSTDACILPAVPFLPLLPEDPLSLEQFCLVLTPQFGLVLVIGDDRRGLPHFQFSFEAEALHQCCQVLLHRLELTGSPQRPLLGQALQRFPFQDPDFRLVSTFMRLLLDRVPMTLTPAEPLRVVLDREEPLDPEPPPPPRDPPPAAEGDVKLLQALAHEIRTPLATIRTLTRLLLKRQDLAPAVVQRLHTIDQECTEQIDRFGLIFRAAEWESSLRQGLDLAPTALATVFAEAIPRWQHQAQRRCLQLQVHLPDRLPTVLSDPDMLHHVLTSLVDRFIRHLPPQSEIEMEVSIAGNQLKLQLTSQLPPLAPEPMLPALADDVAADWRSFSFADQFEALGDLLLLQPETGRLSLNLEVTKNLFQAIGGKLLIRDKVDRGEVLTVFLPLAQVNGLR